jgi:hypothetical protein
MTISYKVIYSVFVPLLVFTTMLAKTQMNDKAENNQEKTVNVQALEAYIESRNVENTSRSYIRLPLGEKVMNTGKKYIGTPYCHGGDDPSCFDCSGFTQYVYSKIGIDIARVADVQLSQMNRVSQKDAKPGDLVFFINGHGHAYHVGIYIGNNRIIHSPKPHRKVREETIWSSKVIFARY